MKKRDFVHTGNVKEPIGWLPDVSNEGEELDVALIQSLILTAEGKYTTERFRCSVGIIDFASDPETHFRSREFVT